MVGCIIYETCTLKKPFSGPTFHALMQNIISKPYESIPDIYSKELVDLIDMLLTKNPEKRPMISNLLSGVLKQRYDSYLENKSKIQSSCNSDRIPSSTKISLNTSEETLVKPSSSAYFSSNSSYNINEKNPFDLNDSKSSISKGYESTPVKKMNDSLSGFTHSTNDSFTKISSSAYLSNSAISKDKVRTRKASLGFINQSQVMSIADSEFFDSEKPITINTKTKKLEHGCKNPFSTGNQPSSTKAPIKIIKQRIPPHLNMNAVLNEKKQMNLSKDSSQSGNENKSENLSQSLNRNEIPDVYKNNFKLMFNFLKEKIGDKLTDQLLTVLDTRNEESILKSLAENEEKIKFILGNYYKQVVSLLMHIIKLSPRNKIEEKETHIFDNSPLLESNMDIVRAHKKHYSVGGKSAFASSYAKKI